ncbi:Uncharacterised protein [Mycobacterium tuberculosis]|nr:Uncharacterised protein [Mycobacterium tuberculosis]
MGVRGVRIPLNGISAGAVSVDPRISSVMGGNCTNV